MLEQSRLNALAFVRDTCGKIIRLGDFESVAGLKIEPTRITLAISRAQSTPHRGFGWHITKRGTSLYSFTLETRTGVWSLADVFTTWTDADELVGEASKPRDSEWEDMCHRPGTTKNPLDNFVRRKQGY